MAKSGFKEYVHKVSSTSGIVPNRKEGGEGEVYTTVLQSLINIPSKATKSRVDYIPSLSLSLSLHE